MRALVDLLLYSPAGYCSLDGRWELSQPPGVKRAVLESEG